MPRIQIKIMVALAALVLVVSVTSGVVAERTLRQREMERIESSMRERALLLAQMVTNLPAESSSPAGVHAVMDAMADTAAQAAGARVTLIDRDGRVMGDSVVSASSLPDIENHADRPEVRAALAGEVGISTRTSKTVRLRLLYVALPLQHGRGLVRHALDLASIDAAAAHVPHPPVSLARPRLVPALARPRPCRSTGTAKSIRLAAGVSLPEVARDVGVSHSTVHRWENNLNVPKGDPALRYAEVLDELSGVSL